MPSRDVWKHGGGRLLQDLLGSALITLLLPSSDVRPVYFASPWMSDFVLVANAVREFADLFPAQEEQGEITFVDYLSVVARRREIRIITMQNPTSNAFVERLLSISDASRSTISIRLSSQETHEKGILSPGFYIEGSMNITHMGVHVNGEKIVYHSGRDDAAEKISAAYLEFDRRWRLLASAQVEL